jgi:predicted NUDIX family NTP pyrophosphohydrolase
MTVSTGMLMWRRRSAGIEVLLVHFGGSFWAEREAGAWTIPKGMVLANEEPEDAARREFAEELGSRPEGPIAPLVASSRRAANGSRRSR